MTSNKPWKLQLARQSSTGLRGGGNKASQPATPLKQGAPSVSKQAHRQALRWRRTNLDQQGSNWVGADLSDLVLNAVDFRDSCLDYANLANAKLVNANLLRTSVRGQEYPVPHTTALHLNDGPQLFDFGTCLNPVAFSPNHIYACGSSGLRLKLVELLTGNMRNIHEHKGSIRVVCFSADSSLMLSAGSDCAIHIWEVPSGNSAFVLPLDSEAFCASFLPDNTSILYSLADHSLQIWRQTNETTSLAPAQGQLVVASPSWNRLATASATVSTAVNLWKFPSMAWITKLPPDEAPVKTLCFGTDENYLVVGLTSGKLRVFDVARASAVGEAQLDSLEAVYCEETCLVLRLQHSWELTSVEALIRGRPAARPVFTALGQNAEGSFLGVFQENTHVYSQVLGTGARTEWFKHEGGALILSPDCKHLGILSVIPYYHLEVFAVDTMKKLELEFWRSNIDAVVFVPGTPLVVISQDSFGEVWDMETSELVWREALDGPRALGISASGSLVGPFQTYGDVREAVLSPNGEWLAWIDRQKCVNLQHSARGYVTAFRYMKKPSVQFNETSTHLIICGGLVSRVVRLKAFR